MLFVHFCYSRPANRLCVPEVAKSLTALCSVRAINLSLLHMFQTKSIFPGNQFNPIDRMNPPHLFFHVCTINYILRSYKDHNCLNLNFNFVIKLDTHTQKKFMSCHKNNSSVWYNLKSFHAWIRVKVEKHQGFHMYFYNSICKPTKENFSLSLPCG